MAFYCLTCTNEYFMDENLKLTQKDVKTVYELCEGCGKWQPCIKKIKKRFIWRNRKKL